MGMIKFEVPHSLSREEAKKRIEQLTQVWGSKYGMKTSWNGDGARMTGKVMGINIDATLTVADNKVGGEATDPGFLFREKAKKYLQEKFATFLDPKKKAEDLQRDG
jgi:hypothetical protein